MKQKPLVIALVVVLLLVAAAVAGVLLADPAGFVAAKKDALAKSMSETLGREVTVGPVEGRFLGGLGAKVSDVKVAGPTPDSAPQISVGTMEVRLSLWRAIFTLGRDLRVTRIEVNAPQVRAARDAEGRWDFQDVLDRLAAQEPAPTVEDPTGSSILDRVHIARLRIVDARIVLDDAKLGRPLTISDLDVTSDEIATGKKLAVSLSATLEDGTRKTPLTLSLDVARLPKGMSFDPMPDLAVDLDVGDLDLAPWGGLLPPDALSPAGGTVRVKGRLEATRNLAALVVKGESTLTKVVLRQGNARGETLDLAMTIDATIDQTAPRYVVKAFSVKGTGVDAGGTLDAKGLGPTDLTDADLHADVADLRRLVAVLPAGSGMLPPELVLEGPLAAKVKGSPAALEVKVDLDRARVRYGDSFDKAAGKALHATMTGTRTDAALELKTVELVLDRARVGGSMTLPTAEGKPMRADLASGPIELASLRDVFPPFRKALAAGKPVAGVIELALKAEDAAGKQKARATLALRDLAVELEGSSALGAGALDVSVTPGEATTTATAKADFGALQLRTVGEDGTASLDKPAGMPLTLDAEGIRTPARFEIVRAKAVIGTTALSARGNATGLDGDAPVLDVDLGNVDVKFDDLRRALPGAAALPAGGRMRGAIRIGGAPSSLATVKVAVTGLDLELTRSRLKGSLSVENLEKPNFAFDLAGDALDADALLGTGSEEAADAPPPENPHGLPAETRAFLAGVNGKGSLKVGLLTTMGMPLRNFVGTMIVTNGVVRFEALDFVLYEGKVSAAGTVADLRAERTGYALAFKVKGMDLGAALAAHTRLDGVVKGKVDESLTVAGRGLAWQDAVSTLRGPLELEASALSLPALDVLGPIANTVRSVTDGGAKAGMTASGATAGGAAPEGGGAGGGGANERGTTLRDIAAQMRFQGGRLQFVKPTTFKTAFGALTTEGDMFLDTRLDLKATAELSPETITSWTGGRVKVPKPVAVPLKIVGTWSKPEVGGIDVRSLAAAMISGAALAGIDPRAGAVVGAVTDPAKAKAEAEAAARAAAADAEAKAKAELERQQKAANDAARAAEADAKRRVEEARKKAEAEAKRKAEEARKKAEQRAREELEKAMGGG